MPRRTISLSTQHNTFLLICASVLNATVSDVLADLLDYIRTNADFSDIWATWDELYAAYRAVNDGLEIGEGDDAT
jgi:hypothetical protein